MDKPWVSLECFWKEKDSKDGDKDKDDGDKKDKKKDNDGGDKKDKKDKKQAPIVALASVAYPPTAALNEPVYATAVLP